MCKLDGYLIVKGLEDGVFFGVKVEDINTPLFPQPSEQNAD